MPQTRYFFGPAFEQFPPEDLLRQAIAAERAGFDAAVPPGAAAGARYAEAQMAMLDSER